MSEAARVDDLRRVFRAITPHGVKVRQMLRSGLGVEDISVRLGLPLSDVRALVSDLRERGLLRCYLGCRGHWRNNEARKTMGLAQTGGSE